MLSTNTPNPQFKGPHSFYGLMDKFSPQVRSEKKLMVSKVSNESWSSDDDTMTPTGFGIKLAIDW